MSSLGLLGRKKPKNIVIDPDQVQRVPKEILVAEKIQQEIKNLEPSSML